MNRTDVAGYVYLPWSDDAIMSVFIWSSVFEVPRCGPRCSQQSQSSSPGCPWGGCRRYRGCSLWYHIQSVNHTNSTLWVVMRRGGAAWCRDVWKYTQKMEFLAIDPLHQLKSEYLYWNLCWQMEKDYWTKQRFGGGYDESFIWNLREEMIFPIKC